jgi:hypothetical protein
MTQDIKEHAPQTKESGGLLRHLFERSGRDTPGPDATPERSTLDLADIQGFILRGYRMPVVRHFL